MTRTDLPFLALLGFAVTVVMTLFAMLMRSLPYIVALYSGGN